MPGREIFQHLSIYLRLLFLLTVFLLCHPQNVISIYPHLWLSTPAFPRVKYILFQ